MKTETLAFAKTLNDSIHILRSQAGRNAQGTQLLNKQGLPQSDRFVKMTEFAGASDKTPKAVRDARATMNAWAVISPSLPEFSAEVAQAQASLIAEAKAASEKARQPAPASLAKAA